MFITTPPCLLRILEDHKNSYALNFKRLCHYVLDQADVLITKFLHEVHIFFIRLSYLFSDCLSSFSFKFFSIVDGRDSIEGSGRASSSHKE